MIKVYEYKNCGTCKKALAFLDKKGIAYKNIPIRDPLVFRRQPIFMDVSGGGLKEYVSRFRTEK